MWKRILAIIALFYLFALLQNSFFVHYSLLGAVPDLVFVLFFGLVFVPIKNLRYFEIGGAYRIIFLAVCAGFFMDTFMYPYLGPSIISFLIIGFALRRVQLVLLNKDGRYPFLYFLVIFIISLLGYYMLLGLIANRLSPFKFLAFFPPKIIFCIIYDSIFATVFFYIYNAMYKINFNARQLRLFR